MNGPLTVGSLFSGIGGFDLGFDRAGGFRTEWFCEQNEFCQRVLAKHWPGVPCHPDVTQLRAADVAPVDLLCGGFPCQDLSVAGRGAGLDGARSGLYAEVMRLVGEFRPKYVVLENVPAIRSRGLGRVLGEMAALGYDCEWDCIPASAVGAHHQRDRWWLVAYPQRHELRNEQGWCGRPSRREPPLPSNNGAARPLADANGDDGGSRRPGGSDSSGSRQFEPQRALFDAGPGSTDVADACGPGLEGHGTVAGEPEVAEPRDGRASLADTESLSLWPRLCTGESAAERWGRLADCYSPEGEGSLEPGVGRLADGFPTGVDGRWTEPDLPRVAADIPQRKERLMALGNALVPQIAEWLGARIMSYENSLIADYSAAA